MVAVEGDGVDDKLDVAEILAVVEEDMLGELVAEGVDELEVEAVAVSLLVALTEADTVDELV